MTGKPLGTKAAVEAMKQISEQNQRKSVTCSKCGKVFFVRKAARWANCPLCMELVQVQ